ncbi:hypothetical protein [Janibacter sp. DB-40]|uniref:hypothetical protein n=1 Tax=Janibacter sp. DB-40 TaxID=3028808 RepID=UPI00240702B1|nr:hypothetical protein [Janibacter sp. DB-40]
MGRRWGRPLRVRTFRALGSTLVRSSHPFDSFEHLVGGRGAYPWETVLRTPVGQIPLWVPTARDADEVLRAFHRHDYGSGKPQVVVDVGSPAGISTAFFLSRSDTTRVHVWESGPTHLDAVRRNVAQFAGRCTVHPVMLATSSVRGMATEGIGDALRGVLRLEDHIDLLKFDVAGIDDHLITAIPLDVLPDICEIVHRVSGGVRRHHPHGPEPEYTWHLAD